MSDQVTELDPFAAAVAAATAELGEGTPDDAETSDPLAPGEDESDDNQAPGEEDEQAEEKDGPPAEAEGEESDELFAEVELEELVEETQPETPDSFILPGIDEPVTLEELKNGYLRQADYTKKTQELAAARKDMRQAEELWNALRQHPVELAKQLAQAAGLIDEGATPVRVVDLPFMSAEELEAEVEARVQAALAEHPDLAEAQRIQGQLWIESEFNRIESSYGVTLGEQSRKKVLQEAYRLDTDNLELVFLKLKQMADEQARKREQAKRAAPRKPTGKSTVETQPTEVSSFEDAVELATAELAAAGKL